MEQHNQAKSKEKDTHLIGKIIIEKLKNNKKQQNKELR